MFIVGPTASGKTALAFGISKKIPSVLISADSIQVYRGADIISGKDKSHPTFLLDIISPDEPFSVRDFVEHVRPIVYQAFKEHRVPIIVGGTGFYAEALFRNIDTINVPPNHKVREELEKLSLAELQKELQKLNPVHFKKMNNSDVNNKRRLIRAIEVVALANSNILKTEPVFCEQEILTIGLKTSMENLKIKINVRVRERIKSGALDEAKRLFKNYENLSPQIKAACGYRELFKHLRGSVSLNEAVEKWITAEGQLAKKQMTFLRRNKNIVWFDTDEKGYKSKILRLVIRDFIL